MTGTNGKTTAIGEVARLQAMSLGELKDAYVHAFGKPPSIADRKRIFRVLARKVQEDLLGPETGSGANGDEVAAPKKRRTSGRARAEIASKAPVVRGPKSGRPLTLSPGTKLTREYKGKRVTVVVMDDGTFEYAGKIWRSLSAIANSVTGSHVSGNAWFGIRARKGGAS